MTNGEGHGRPYLGAATVVIVASMLASACYLPRADIQRTVESEVLVAVFGCSATVVSGELRNDSDVDVLVEIRPRWLDAERVSFHEVEIDPIDVPAGSRVEWEAEAEAELERPGFCESEILAITETS